MGCDIHAHVEYKINDKWEHVKEVDIHRSYQLFGHLVKGHSRSRESSIGIKEAQGLPKDVNAFTKMCLDDVDYHTHSYLTGIQLKKLYVKDSEDNYPFLSDGEYNYIFSIEEIFSKNFRLVFAFDN